MNNNFIFQQCLKLYNNNFCPYTYSYMGDKDKIQYEKENICLTYGEMLPESVDILINHIKCSWSKASGSTVHIYNIN